MSQATSPELYGWSLLAAAHALEWLPMASEVVAKNAHLFKLRGRVFNEDLTMHPIHTLLEQKTTATESSPSVPGVQFDVSHKSVSPFLSFWDYHEAYTTHRTTPLEVAHRLIHALNEKREHYWMRSFDAASILEQAKASTERYKNNQPLGLLDGIFIPLKEEIDIVGYETKCGTAFMHGNEPATVDSTVVRKLREAGAIIAGHTIMNELGWDIFSINPNTGTPKNPYKHDHSCGGSSGGAGGCVAAGLFPASLGADGGGSVRIPASFCGLYGLKPTFGRISTHGGAAIDPSLSVFGPLAATADDMALIYSVIAGKDPHDLHSLHQPPVSLDNYYLTNTLEGIRIGILECPENTAEPVFKNNIEAAKRYLESLGATITSVSIPDLDIARVAHSLTICFEMDNFARSKGPPHAYLPYTRLMMSISSHIKGSDYVKAQQVRTRLMNYLTTLFNDVDLVLSPTTSIQAPLIPSKAHAYGMSNTKLTLAGTQYLSLANLTGIPAVSVPIGFHNDLPVGLQLMAGWWQEALLLRMAKVLERMPGIEKRCPNDLKDILYSSTSPSQTRSKI
ncbi:amidase signature domain-containing protein [Spinellus fusiger]|nr:amidase signature domain-containing protein [Spinellus fusiger]